MEVGYHVSHEQFSPSRLLSLCRLAEDAGFAQIKSSDHFHPWSERQGQSGFAWAWLGAALQSCALPIGTIAAPGYRYHPAIIAQAAATLAEMFPDRFWMALGSGEAINEAITGLPWPEKSERMALLEECVAIIRALFAGEEVTHRGRVTVIGAKLYSRPANPVPLMGAAVTKETAARVAGWADGLLTVGGKPENVAQVLDAFRENGGEGKPVHVQHALSWAPTRSEAMAEVRHQWRHAVLGGDAMWDLRRPADFDAASASASDEALDACLPISEDLGRHTADIAALAALGVTVHLHSIGRNQEQFLDMFGTRVLPQLT
ncbi:MAG: TIGR03885 family FMN-dependent LLM class oxidoreductase [Acetobacteraceae bacterium]|nr:MAG: TIGR03885 family FMN-dependent LLM class oxidoreductase [Acetobacteraceae bacterium]